MQAWQPDLSRMRRDVPYKLDILRWEDLYLGQPKRGVGICCFQENNDASVTLKERCERACYLTDEDFLERKNITLEVENKNADT